MNKNKKISFQFMAKSSLKTRQMRWYYSVLRDV